MMKDRHSQTEQRCLDRWSEHENEELWLDYDEESPPDTLGPAVSSQDPTDWTEVATEVTEVMHQSHLDRGLRQRLLKLLRDERKRNGAASKELVDQFMRRVISGDLGSLECDVQVAECILVVGWSDFFSTCGLDELRDFHANLFQTEARYREDGIPAYRLYPCL